MFEYKSQEEGGGTTICGEITIGLRKYEDQSIWSWDKCFLLSQDGSPNMFQKLETEPFITTTERNSHSEIEEETWEEELMESQKSQGKSIGRKGWNWGKKSKEHGHEKLE